MTFDVIRLFIFSLYLNKCIPKCGSGIRRLKTPFRSTMSNKRESDLNLLQMQTVTDIDVDAVAKLLINKQPRRMFGMSVLFD